MWNSVPSAFRHAVNEEMVCASKRFKSMCAVRLTRQKNTTANVVQNFAVHITVTSVRSSVECAHKMMLYSPTISVVICGQANAVKLSFGLFPRSKDKSSNGRHPRPERYRRHKHCTPTVASHPQGRLAPVAAQEETGRIHSWPGCHQHQRGVTRCDEEHHNCTDQQHALIVRIQNCAASSLPSWSAFLNLDMTKRKS